MAQQKMFLNSISVTGVNILTSLQCLMLTSGWVAYRELQ